MTSGGNLLRTGVIGTVIVALCCFTPVLVILLGAVGLSALTGYLDLVLIPALGFFILLTAYALYRRSGQPQS
ncbi:mercury resistance system transport protein MerF [Thalassobaculum sp.]|uniref:mercury resistance system transport protein MerF n=1 Tax=Thalassobaculum sp. TaxID=2022740 RepID=UPI0032ECFA13